MKNKIMLTYLMGLMYLMTLSSCHRKAEPETYLVPKDFIGRVNIIMNQKEGSEKKYEDGRRVYEIPTDGVLLTQFTINDGLTDRKYYSVDGAGKRTELEVFKFEHFKKDSAGYVVKNKEQVGIFLNGTSGQYGNPPNAVWWQEFMVCSSNNKDSLFTPQSKKEFEGKLTAKLGFEVNVP